MLKSPITQGYPSMPMLRIVEGGEAEEAFVFTVQTAGADTFQLPLEASGTYDFVVKWGDSNSDTITAWNDAAANHSYAGAGTYTVKITGTITGWRFNNAGDKTLIYEIQSWGPLNLGNNNGYFYGCVNLTITATDILDMTNTTTVEVAFGSCSSLTTVPSMNSWDMSAVTTLKNTFYNCTLFNQNIGSWDISSVNSLYGLFTGAKAFNQDIGSWNTSAVTTLRNTFQNAWAFNQDISAWNTALVETMQGVFYVAKAFNQNVGGWNVSSVTNMTDAFRQAEAFNQDISSWDVSSVTNMDYMLALCANFNQNISGWDTGAVTTMIGMFYTSTAFDQDLSGWDIADVTDMTNFLISVTLSTANYDALLIGWEGQAVQNNVTFHGGNSKYSAGAAATARQALIDDHTWTFTDGGQV